MCHRAGFSRLAGGHVIQHVFHRATVWKVTLKKNIFMVNETRKIKYSQRPKSENIWISDSAENRTSQLGH